MHPRPRSLRLTRSSATLALCLGFAPATARAQTIAITTPEQSVDSTYVRISGTASGVTLPMWYEVRDAGGRLTDYGAFGAAERWSAVVRHLSAGVNTVTVFGAASPAAIASASVVLSIDVSGAPKVRPRPAPAEVWWGGTADNAQLRDNPDAWQTVKQHADAFFLHTAAWGEEMNPVLASLVQQLAPVGTKFVAELGGQTGTEPTWPEWQHVAWGAGGDGWIVNRHRNTGLVLTEATHDFHPRVKDFATAYPTASEEEILTRMAGYWREYFARNNAVLPHLKHAVTHSPVWWGWKEYGALGGDLRDDDYVFSMNGRGYAFDYFDVMSALRRATNELAGNSEWGFYSDFPYYTMVWPADAPYDGAHVRQKVYAYEAWLHSVGARHTMVAIEDPMDKCPDLDAVHRKFAENGLAALRLYQREGGRADRYELESWYACEGIGWVPTRVTPEDEPYTFTWLAKQAIRFVKGIKSADGALEELALSVVPSDGEASFELRNAGESPCLPALQAFERGDAGISARWFDASGTDVTAAVTSAEGWVPPDLLEPGATTRLRCVVSRPAGGTGKEFSLEAFWNPQDPTGVVRSRASAVFGELSIEGGAGAAGAAGAGSEGAAVGSGAAGSGGPPATGGASASGGASAAGGSGATTSSMGGASAGTGGLAGPAGAPEEASNSAPAAGESGCGCRAPAGQPRGGLAGLVLVLGGALHRGRRRGRPLIAAPGTVPG